MILIVNINDVTIIPLLFLFLISPIKCLYIPIDISLISTYFFQKIMIKTD